MLKDKEYDRKKTGETLRCESASCDNNCCKHCCPLKQQPNALGGIQVQLQGTANGLLENNSSILFDTVLSQSNPDIQYNGRTGEFTLAPRRNYFVSWEAMIDGTETSLSVDFGTAIDGNVVSVSPSAQVTCQISGTALVATGRLPEKLSIYKDFVSMRFSLKYHNIAGALP